MKLFIFGSTGDLVRKKVLFALQNFKDLKVYALGRKNFDTKSYKKEYFNGSSLNLEYLKVNFEKELLSQIKDLLSTHEINYFYIALPPEQIKSILQNLNMIHKNDYNLRILIEKPFGNNLKSALIIKKCIIKNKLVKLVFLADHYIFKESVLNLKNRDFSKLYIKNLEKVGLENRVYYDSVGALRDMVQSHFFNILFRLIKFNLKDIQIRDYQRKQYKSYTIDLGKKSETETYVKLVLKIKGKEVIFETGKGFDQKDSTISIDGKTYDLASGKDPYEVMFDDFFLDKREHFPTMENAILAWKIIQKIEKMKDRLELY